MLLRILVVLFAVALGVVASFVLPLVGWLLLDLEASSYEDFLPVWLVALPVFSIGFGLGAHRFMNRVDARRRSRASASSLR